MAILWKTVSLTIDGWMDTSTFVLATCRRISCIASSIQDNLLICEENFDSLIKHSSSKSKALHLISLSSFLMVLIKLKTNFRSFNVKSTSYLLNMDNRAKNIIYTVLIFLNHFAMGLTSNLIWPALVDIRFIYGEPQATINYLSAFGNVGHLIGSFSGFLYKWINKQFYLSIMMIMFAITVMLVPLYPSIAWLFIAMIFSSMGGGSWDSSNCIWLVEMWPESQGFFLQALQFMYGIGSIIGPSLVSPFVFGLENSTDIAPLKRRQSLMIPFAIGGLIQVSIPLMMLVLYFVNRYERPIEETDQDDHEQDAINNTPLKQRMRPTKWWRTKLILITISLATYSATESAFFVYSSQVFQYSPGLSASEAARVMAVLTAFYTLGRFLTAFIALKLQPDIILIYHYTIIIVAQSLLYFTHQSTVMIYLTTAIRGFGFSAMWPAFLSFIEKHLKLSDRNCTLLYVSTGLFPMLTPVLIGGLLESKPMVLFLFEGIYITASCIFFTICKLLVKFVR